MRRRKGLPSYSDGVVGIYKDNAASNDFGAKRNVRKLSDMIPVVSLAYSLSSCRAEDFEFAERRDFSLSVKLRTILVESVRPNHKAVIGGLLYEVKHVGRTGSEMYLYLEGGRPVDTQ